MSRQDKTSVEIGTRMPAWLPPAWHLPAKLVLGILIGLLVAYYCVAISFTINRVWWGVTYGAPSDEIAFDIAYLAIMIGAAYLVRHVLKRGRARPVAEM